jgi:hypothetical protein
MDEPAEEARARRGRHENVSISTGRSEPRNKMKYKTTYSFTPPARIEGRKYVGSWAHNGTETEEIRGRAQIPPHATRQFVPYYALD